MNLMRRKRQLSVIIAALSVMLLGGCGDEIPELTPEQQELVTEYSAALLLKYDSNSPSRLLPEGTVVSIDFVDPNNPDARSAEIIPEDMAVEEYSDISVDSEPAHTSDETYVTDVVTGESSGPTSYGEGFTGFLAGTGADMAYSGRYEILDSYPEGESANPYFTVDASAGNKLLILHFDLLNPTGDDIDVNLSSLNLRYRVSLNGGKNKFVMTTLLGNDLLSYAGTIPAASSQDIVAVCEVSEEEAANIQTIDFTIRSDSNSSVISLQ